MNNTQSSSSFLIYPRQDPITSLDNTLENTITNRLYFQTKRIQSDKHFSNVKRRNLFAKENLKISNFQKAMKKVNSTPDLTSTSRYSISGGLQRVEEEIRNLVDAKTCKSEFFENLQKFNEQIDFFEKSLKLGKIKNFSDFKNSSFKDDGSNKRTYEYRKDVEYLDNLKLLKSLNKSAKDDILSDGNSLNYLLTTMKNEQEEALLYENQKLREKILEAAEIVRIEKLKVTKFQEIQREQECKIEKLCKIIQIKDDQLTTMEERLTQLTERGGYEGKIHAKFLILKEKYEQMRELVEGEVGLEGLSRKIQIFRDKLGKSIAKLIDIFEITTIDNSREKIQELCLSYFKENSIIISALGFEPLILNIIKSKITSTPGKLKFPSRYAPPIRSLTKVDKILEENKENLPSLANMGFSFHPTNDKRNFKAFNPDPRLFETGSSEFIENAKLRDMKIEKLDLNPVNIYRANDDYFDLGGIYDSTLRYNQKILNFQKVSSNMKNSDGNVFKDQSFGSLR